MRFLRLPGSRMLLGLAVLLGTAGLARADLSIAIVHADTDASAMNVQAKLIGSGLFGQVDLFDSSAGTPTLAQLSSYGAVLAYTNYAPDDGTALGNVLADYVDAGHGLVLATYGLADAMTPFGSTAFAGKIATTGYSPLVISGNLGDLDGAVMATVPADPIFNGVNLAAPDFYYHDSLFAHPDLDAGAVSLATDGSGVNLIARSASGRIIGLNMFPGSGATDNSDEFYKLLANSLQNVAPTAVPEPASWLLIAQAVLGFVAVRGAGVRRVKKR
jgi:hypothetical protein